MYFCSFALHMTTMDVLPFQPLLFNGTTALLGYLKTVRLVILKIANKTYCDTTLGVGFDRHLKCIIVAVCHVFHICQF